MRGGGAVRGGEAMRGSGAVRDGGAVRGGEAGLKTDLTDLNGSFELKIP